MNLDATFKLNKAVCAMVVRNDREKHLYLATIIIKCDLAYAVELKALAWASTYAEEANWRNIQWVMNAKEVVLKITDKSKPGGWDMRLDVLRIKARFVDRSWQLIWNHRSSNLATNMVVKLTLRSLTPLYFDEFNYSFIPSCIVDIIFVDEVFVV